MSLRAFLYLLVVAAPISGASNLSVFLNQQVCFDKLGCFENKFPWSSVLRPVPLPTRPEKIPVTVYFFTRQNPTKPNIITTYPEIKMESDNLDGNRPTAVIIHGHGDNITKEWLHDLKDVYLKRLDANVLIADWGPGASEFYPVSVSNTRVTARLISILLKYLMQNHGLTSDKIHLIGHSLGAQVASYVGKETPNIGRLTALEPAQPLYEGHDSRVHIDKSDAVFVEVIHTNSLSFILFFGRGSIGPSGHVDFYFNGGGRQVSCITPKTIPKINTLLDVFLFKHRFDNYTGLCSHEEAYRYLIEAYNRTTNCVFWGRKLPGSENESSIMGGLWSLLLTNSFPFSISDSFSCKLMNCIPFGLETIDSNPRGIFTVRTNNQSPYCYPDDDAITNNGIKTSNNV